MGIPERKERQKQELKESILTAVEELFVKDGYRNISMRKIAAMVEYSPSTIYRFFSSKADLVNELIARGYGGIYDRYQTILSNRGNQPLETLNEIIKTYIEFALENPNHFQLWLETSEIQVLNGKLHMQHGDLVYQVYSVWLDLIEECRTAGHFGDRETMTVFQLIWGPIVGIISLRIRHENFP